MVTLKLTITFIEKTDLIVNISCHRINLWQYFKDSTPVFLQATKNGELNSGSWRVKEEHSPWPNLLMRHRMRARAMA